MTPARRKLRAMLASSVLRSSASSGVLTLGMANVSRSLPLMVMRVVAPSAPQRTSPLASLGIVVSLVFEVRAAGESRMMASHEFLGAKRTGHSSLVKFSDIFLHEGVPSERAQ